MLTHRFLYSSRCLSYSILAVPTRKCSGKHSCMSSIFPIVILNDTSFFPTVKLQVYNENPAPCGRNKDALVNLNTKLNLSTGRLLAIEDFTFTYALLLGKRSRTSCIFFVAYTEWNIFFCPGEIALALALSESLGTNY